MDAFLQTLIGILEASGFYAFFQADGWKYAVMIAVACGLLYLAIVKKFEPLLLLPIAFGMLLANLPGAGVYHPELWVVTEHGIDFGAVLHDGGVLDILYMGVKLGIY
ncbi:MAG: sodium ion-translocating decarboxylase subunit beta, partial [Acutalibacteraceae bacterium]|nr:sodium ion-translocating decarboxylase subunit beta [Acutalibacteraceae bacterium]